MMDSVAHILIVSDVIKPFSYLHQLRHVKYHEHEEHECDDHEYHEYVFPHAGDAASGKGLQ